MEPLLEGKFVIVTGAGGGIGSAAAALFAEEGAELLLVDRDSEALAGAVAAAEEHGGRAHAFAADVSDADAVAAYVRRALELGGRIDGLFNNAGIQGTVATLVEYEPEEFDRIIAVNLRGVFLGLRYVLPAMIERGAGAVVNTASTTGVTGFSSIPAYTASKHGVIGLTRAAAAEVSRAGIRVNALAPGMTETPMVRETEVALNPKDPDAMRAGYVRAVPSGRYGRPPEQAAAAAFLLSDRSAYVNGTVLMNDGGMTGTREIFG
jgi:NAD(P)-dependent dehydrogenase (short-subunit alcohol dehydrogenase family)